MGTTPTDILAVAFERAATHLDGSLVSDLNIRSRIEGICRDLRNRACARFVMSCCLAKAHRTGIDIRKPYTDIPDSDSYSGRTYDDNYVTEFVLKHALPCNATTAFLTPAFRTGSGTLTPDTELGGRPRQLYKDTLQLLTDVQTGTVSAIDVLSETVRCLLVIRSERRDQIAGLLTNIRTPNGVTALSSEGIVTLVDQHLRIAHSSRLPVLVVAAAYRAAEQRLGELVLTMTSHNAADSQTGSLGDLEIALVAEERAITCYEMKTRRVTQNDIDQALQKLKDARHPVDNYIFVTTEPIEEAVKVYAASIYHDTGGIEVVVLDCIGFLQHFLHLFHRLRCAFLDVYQQMVLDEPKSAVDQPLKVAFLALRQAVESRSMSGE